MKALFILPFLLSFAIRCAAQDILFTGTEKSLLIGSQTSLFYDSSGRLGPVDITSRQPWRRLEQKVTNLPHSPGACWLRFTLRNLSPAALLLEVDQPLLPLVRLYREDSPGVITMVPHLMGGRSKVHHHNQVFSLDGGRHTYYLRIQPKGLPVPLRIWTRDRYERQDGMQKIAYGIYIGILLFVVVNNLLLFFSLRRRAYLHYTLLVAMYGMFSIIYEGYLPYFYPQADAFKWYVLNPILNQPNGLLYCMLFLEVKKYLPRWHKIALAFLIYFTSYIGWHVLLPEGAVLVFNQIHALIGILLMATLGLRAAAKGNRLGYYFALAYFIFFAIAAIEVTYDLTGSPTYLLDISHISIGILIEVFILAYLLSRRFQWEKEEVERARELAQEELLEETRKNERLVREQNVILDSAVIERTAQLQAEKQKSDNLLLNILPAGVAEELKEKGFAHAKQYDEVSVLFTDFVDFTITAEHLSPQALVNELHDSFTAFDSIIERNGLEKIKTIGDAYMAVCGLPVTDPLHARKTIRAALEIRDFVANRKNGGAGFDIRIGINSGPVVAGIVGVKKFAYDIWGDTVNTAARMEQCGEAGKINISGATYALVKDEFAFTARGKIEAKNKGAVDMYFVEFLKSPAASV